MGPRESSLYQAENYKKKQIRILVMSFYTAYYDAIVRKDPPASLKEVPTTFPIEPKKAEADKKKVVKP